MKLAPNKFTPEVRNSILQAVRMGCYLETAAAFAGISKQTLFNWLRLGAQDVEPFVEFHRDFAEALAKSEMRGLAVIGKASEKSWQAAAWLLERRYPKRWGQGRDTEVVRRQKMRADIKLAEARRVALLDWDDVVSRATDEQRKELVDLAERIKRNPSQQGTPEASDKESEGAKPR
jgi:hypothetical protein